MRLISIVLLSLLICCRLVSTASQASPGEPGQCTAGDNECHHAGLEEEFEKEDNNYAAINNEPDYIDIPWLDHESSLHRLDPGLGWYTNVLHCWPSVGGIIIAEGVDAVELDYIGIDRFRITPRSLNATDEDAFCMKLRKIGGKWWDSYWDYHMTIHAKARMMWPDEREVLLLGWPEGGGVWVLRFDNRKAARDDLGPVFNALNMEERCLTLEMFGAVFFERPEESELVKPLLEGFGNREKRRDPEAWDGGWWDHGYEL